jgi:hypothetical protein
MYELITLRVDAVHPLGGEFSYFYPELDTGHAARFARRMECCGWFVDAYRERFPVPDGLIPRKLMAQLMGLPWPNVSPVDLLELLESPGPAPIDHNAHWVPTDVEASHTPAERAVHLAEEFGVTTAAELQPR